MAVLGIASRNARAYLQELHDGREVHIVRWSCNGRGPRFAVYAWGEDDDAPYPDIATQKARRRAARRVLQDGSIAALLKFGG